MSKSKSSLETLKKKAKSLIEARSKEKNLVLRNFSEDMIPSSEKPVYQFFYGEKASPNSKTYAVTLDADGKETDVNVLRSAERNPFLLTGVKPTGVGSFIGRFPSGTVAIDPESNDLVLGPGEIFSEIITVSIPKNTGAKKVDVYILADTTGSMGPHIEAVKVGANNIVTTLSATIPDITFGVGNYRDFPGDPTEVFNHQLSPTANSADIIAAINDWSLGGGGDTPEGQLFALDKLAEPAGGGIGWRADSKRIIVWFGDAPGHDPVCAAISGEAANITELSVTDKLVNEDISVIAISSGGSGLNADPNGGGDYVASCGAPAGNPGQGTRISEATNGAYIDDIDAENIVEAIIDLVNRVANNIEHLELVPNGSIVPFVQSIAPVAGYGPLSGDEDHRLSFEVRFRGTEKCGLTKQIFYGSLDAVADGTVIIGKPVKITIPACEKHRYTVKFVCGQQSDFPYDLTAVSAGVYTTAIEILNYQKSEIEIKRKIYPTVKAGAPIGRDPNRVGPQLEEVVGLPALSTSMMDGHSLSELIYGVVPQTTLPFTSGVLEITSPVKLSIKATYTATNLETGLTSMSVENVIED